MKRVWRMKYESLLKWKLAPVLTTNLSINSENLVIELYKSFNFIQSKILLNKNKVESIHFNSTQLIFTCVHFLTTVKEGLVLLLKSSG